MQNVPVRRVSARRVKILLKEEGWAEDKSDAQEIFEEAASTNTVYKHGDGRVLLVMTTLRIGRLFNTVGEFRLFKEENERLTRNKHARSHVLEGIFPYGQNFVDFIPTLIDTLSAKFKIPSAELNMTEESLLRIDTAIRRYGKKKSLTPEIFPAIVAYCGEVIRHAVDGEWEMIPAKGFEGIWEPWIAKEDHYFNPFLWVYDELYEQSPFSIAASISVKMKRRGVPRPDIGDQGTILRGTYFSASPSTNNKGGG